MFDFTTVFHKHFTSKREVWLRVIALPHAAAMNILDTDGKPKRISILRCNGCYVGLTLS